MADENPYRAPVASGRAAAKGVRSGRREDLKAVATYQRGIIVCILIYLVAVVGQFALPANLRPVLGVGVLVVGLVGLVFTFLLSMKVYNIGLGILLGILAIIPLIGLLVLLMVNAKATRVLRDNGIEVGLLG